MKSIQEFNLKEITGGMEFAKSICEKQVLMLL